MENSVQAIILAAGKSTRFNAEKTKLASLVCGQPMILFSTKLLQRLRIDTAVVVGHEKELLQTIIDTHHNNTISYIVQEEQRGTGHALACSQRVWQKNHILVINGDMPLVTEAILTDLFNQHKKNNATISFVSSCTSDKTVSKPYGRVVTNEKSIEIIEAKDLVGDPADFCCINAGIYLIQKDFLIDYIMQLNTNNASNEFYITDLIKIASVNQKTVIKVSAPFDSIRGVNTLEELHDAQHIKKSEIIRYWMHKGVRFESLNTTHVDITVTIGEGSYIGNGVHLLGSTVIGSDNRIEPFCFLTNVHSENNVHVLPFSLVSDCTLEKGKTVGPHAYLHKNTHEFQPMHDASYKKQLDKKIFVTKEDVPHDPSAFSFLAARLLHHDIPTDEQ